MRLDIWDIQIPRGEMSLQLPNSRCISPVWQQLFRQQVSRSVDVFIVISKLGLNGVGGQEHSRLWWTVDVVTQDALLHLQEEELLGDFLDQFLGHILREELASKLELQRVLLLHVLGGYLDRNEYWSVTLCIVGAVSSFLLILLLLCSVLFNLFLF